MVSVDSIAQEEFTENLLRKDFAPPERVAIVEELQGYAHGGDRRSDQRRNCDLATCRSLKIFQLLGLSGLHRSERC